MDAVVAYAPGSIGNLGMALDVLGAAVTGAGDEVEARWVPREADGAVLRLDDPGNAALPRAVAAHAAGIAALATWRALEARAGHAIPADRAVALRVRKGLPLAAGQGGSAASAVAAVVAVEALVGALLATRLDDAARLHAALEAEATVAGRHLDNLAPSLLGGVVTTLSVDPPDVIRVPVAVSPWFALVRPHVEVRTAEARAALPDVLPRALVIAQLASVAAMVTALAAGDLALVGRALVDRIAEPVRAARVPGFHDAVSAAREAGAVGAALSGSGPTTFAVCADAATATRVAEAMRAAFADAGAVSDARTATLDLTGATWRAGTL